MLEQPVPNPVAKNPNINTTKVFAAIGIIAIVMVIFCAGVWYYVAGRFNTVSSEDNTTKVSTSSAKTSTESAKKTEKDETADWETYTNAKGKFSIKYPTDWSVWSYGRGVSIAYFQVNSKDETYQDNNEIPQSHVWIDVFTEDYKKTITEGTEFDLDGIKGLYTGRLDTCNVGCYVISAKKGSTVYEIAMSVSRSTKNSENKTAYDDFEKIFLRIAKTFKFL